MQDDAAAAAAAGARRRAAARRWRRSATDRYATCGELIAAAQGALGFGAQPAAPRAPRGHAGAPRSRASVAAAAAAARSPRRVSARQDDARAAAAAGSSRSTARRAASASFTEAAVGAEQHRRRRGRGLGAGHRAATVTRIDPHARRRCGASRGGIPTDIAAGAGAVWVGNGGGAIASTPPSAISRVDPAARRRSPTRPGCAEAPGRRPSVGYPGIAVGDGAVWAVNPDDSIARIDPRTGRIVATVRADASTLAGGRRGRVVHGRGSRGDRIDPRRTASRQTIHVGASALRGIAVGGGAVWAAGEHEGRVVADRAGAQPVTRSIDVGRRVSYVAFGDGAVWAATYVDGRSRASTRARTA